MIHKRDELLIKIDSIVDKLENIQDDASLVCRRQIVLIIENLRSSLSNCDIKLLLKPALDSVVSNLSSIDSNINSKHYSSVQNYLYELVKIIAFFNNANGKQNLQGYHQAVNKNVRLLEKDIQCSIERLNELNELIENGTKSFANTQISVEKSIEQHKAAYEKELQSLTEKYAQFVTESTNKHTEIKNAMLEDQQKFKKEYADQLIAIKEDLSETKTKFKGDVAKTLSDFESAKTTKLEELASNISSFISKTQSDIDVLMDSATEKIGHVASATFSNTYKEYSDLAANESKGWYKGTVISMIFLVGLSIWWFVFTKYNNTDYIALIARICATVGVAVISRYCAIQASKCKVIEMKLRKIQLQMATFDAFVASLPKDEQDRLKIDLTKKIIEQKDWLTHDKNEINIIKDFAKLVNKFGYSVEITKEENTESKS